MDSRPPRTLQNTSMEGTPGEATQGPATASASPASLGPPVDPAKALAAVAKRLATPHQRPEPKRYPTIYPNGVGRPAPDNRIDIKYEAEAQTVLTYALTRPELLAMFTVQLDYLHRYTPRPSANSKARPPAITIERNLREMKRSRFTPFCEAAIAAYNKTHPQGPAIIRERPDFVRVSLKRECVRYFYKLTTGNPDHLRA